MNKGDYSVNPLNLIAMGMPREEVFKWSSTTRIADIPVIKFDDKTKISKANQGLLQRYIEQKVLEVALCQLKKLTFR